MSSQLSRSLNLSLNVFGGGNQLIVGIVGCMLSLSADDGNEHKIGFFSNHKKVIFKQMLKRPKTEKKQKDSSRQLELLSFETFEQLNCVPIGQLEWCMRLPKSGQLRFHQILPWTRINYSC